MANSSIDLGALPVSVPGPFDYLVGTQLGDARRWPLPEVTNAAAILVASINQIVADAYAEMEAVLAGLGYEPSVPYAAGLLMERTTQTVEHNGYIYAPLNDFIPFTTVGTWHPYDSVKFRLVQGVTNTQLASIAGAGMIGFQQLGAGAVSRTVASKMGDRVSLLDFIPESEHAAIFAGTSTYNCSPALNSAVNSRRFNISGGYYHGGPRIYIPGGRYYFATPIQLKRTVVIEGDSGGQSGGFPTILDFATGGITVNRYNTLNGGVEATPTTAADGSVLRNLYITSRAAKGTGPHDGVWLRARALLEDVTVEGFTGHGVKIVASSGSGDPSTEGNANCWQINRLTVSGNGKSGLYLAGADANAGTSVGVNAVGNGEWGILDEAFLGNTHVGAHTEGNGYANSFKGDSRASICSYGGMRYFVVAGSSAAASTVTPGTNGSVWEPEGAGGPVDTRIPTWVSGMTWKEGGSYHGRSNNAITAWLGCYQEPGQGKAQITWPQVITGGQMEPSLSSRATFLRGGSFGNLQLRRGTTISTSFDGGQFDASFGGSMGLNGHILDWSHSQNFPNGVRMQYLGVDYALLDGAGPRYQMYFTGKNTLRHYGRAQVVPYTVEIPSLHIGESNAARQHTTLNAAPTTGQWARGDVVWNNSPTSGGFAGWICTVAGTPGTWKTFGGIST